MKIELPPLPPKVEVSRHIPTGVVIYGYTADQMRSYAAAALAAAAAVAEPVAWDWLRGVMDGIPTREERIGGQREKYVAKEAVMGWLHEGQSRAKRAAPPQREPLTDEQIEDCIDASNRAFNVYRSSGPRGQQITTMDDWKYWLARAIERAHGITKEES